MRHLLTLVLCTSLAVGKATETGKLVQRLERLEEEIKLLRDQCHAAKQAETEVAFEAYRNQESEVEKTIHDLLV